MNIGLTWCPQEGGGLANRRDRTDTRNKGFLEQTDTMVAAYIRRCAEDELGTKFAPRTTDEREEVYHIRVVDMFGECFCSR